MAGRFSRKAIREKTKKKKKNLTHHSISKSATSRVMVPSETSTNVRNELWTVFIMSFIQISSLHLLQLTSTTLMQALILLLPIATLVLHIAVIRSCSILLVGQLLPLLAVVVMIFWFDKGKDLSKRGVWVSWGICSIF